MRAAGAKYAWVAFAGMAISTFAMQRALITRDFSIKYVAEQGSSLTPPLYNVATMWSALEGSILLWGLVLAGYLAIVAKKFSNRLSDPMVSWALVTMFLVTAFFALLMLGPANPFQSFDPPVGYDGPGPNPLLQNHVLVAFHPPILYLGYVGFTVPFAIAIAGKAQKIYLAGFDGFNIDDTKNDETQLIFNLIKKRFKKLGLYSITPTKYNLKIYK